jgi:hypothetical protein
MTKAVSHAVLSIDLLIFDENHPKNIAPSRPSPQRIHKLSTHGARRTNCEGRIENGQGCIIDLHPHMARPRDVANGSVCLFKHGLFLQSHILGGRLDLGRHSESR